MKSLRTGTLKWCAPLVLLCPICSVDTARANPQAPDAVSTDPQYPVTGAAAVMTETSTVQLAIENIRNTNGELRILVFQSSEGFPDDPGRAVFSATKAPAGSVAIEIPGLQVGQRYAFSVMHDENGDGKLNTNFLGIPKEGIGLSRAPNLWLGKPKFEDCAEEVTSNTQIILVKMHYF